MPQQWSMCRSMPLHTAISDLPQHPSNSASSRRPFKFQSWPIHFLIVRSFNNDHCWIIIRSSPRSWHVFNVAYSLLSRHPDLAKPPLSTSMYPSIIASPYRHSVSWLLYVVVWFPVVFFDIPHPLRFAFESYLTYYPSVQFSPPSKLTNRPRRAPSLVNRCHSSFASRTLSDSRQSFGWVVGWGEADWVSYDFSFLGWIILVGILTRGGGCEQICLLWALSTRLLQKLENEVSNQLLTARNQHRQRLPQGGFSWPHGSRM